MYEIAQIRSPISSPLYYKPCFYFHGESWRGHMP